MAFVVQKYGGTSVGSVERVKKVARRVAARREGGDRLIVVVSAMSGETDRLIGLTSEMAARPECREYDVIVSAGEQVSAGLLAIALNEAGCRAKSLLGFQIPVTTEATHTRARIERIEGERIRRELDDGYVVVVPGFQGIDSENNITTLGRGGSDTTAVAIATALSADICEIYTDVEGVYTTDPSVCSDARLIERISYDEMLEMASLGAKVLQTRSVEFAKKYNVPLMVRSSFTDSSGTMVTMEDEDMEKAAVSGITYNKNEAKISIIRIPDRPGIAAGLFAPLTEADINVDMIVQNLSHEGHTDMTFTVPLTDYEKALELIEGMADAIEAEGVVGNREIAKVSIIGAGMRSHAGVASKTFDTLAAEGINIQIISTSEIKISCVIDEKYTELAVRVLHNAFGLGDTEICEEKI